MWATDQRRFTKRADGDDAWNNNDGAQSKSFHIPHSTRLPDSRRDLRTSKTQVGLLK